MSKRVCIIGNSHLAAFKHGWNAIQHSYPEVAFDFFGAPGAQIAEAVISNGVLSASTPRLAQCFQRTSGRETTQLADYDLVVVVGCSVRLVIFTNLLKNYQPPFLNKDIARARKEGLSDYRSMGVIDPFGESRKPTIVSVSLLKELMAARIRQTTAYELISAISEQTKVPVYFVPSPLPSLDILAVEPQDFISRIVEAGKGPEVAEIMWEALYSTMKGKATVVPTPEDMITEGLLIDHRYTIGSVDLINEGAHHQEDLMHMNGEYGVVLIRSFLSMAGIEETAETSRHSKAARGG